LGSKVLYTPAGRQWEAVGQATLWIAAPFGNVLVVQVLPLSPVTKKRMPEKKVAKPGAIASPEAGASPRHVVEVAQASVVICPVSGGCGRTLPGPRYGALAQGRRAGRAA
jgi:hypothetical protein